eukprot:TRINITY_DN694_c1_g1_i1.p1 TRINITY_DN694_c1_g1~~TRINITY_DN694_c1_g1_i1.p1  ORF type:complete len:571 (-),score=154.12 TRINITY_DN694_c1_g1_i1:331-2043(-)
MINLFGNAIPPFVNWMIAENARTEINNVVYEYLEMNHTCPTAIPSDAMPPFNVQTSIISFSSAGGLFIALAIVLLLLASARNNNNAHNNGSATEKKPLLDEKASLYPKLDDEEETTNGHNHHSGAPTTNGATTYKPSLALTPEIPALFRYGVPLALLVNIALFATSNTSVGASVIMVITEGQEVITLPSLFDFSLANSVHDMWDAGVYALALLIAVLSGAWPYAKLVLMLVAWILPERVLSEKMREYLLMILDALGKWSLIDNYVLVLMTTAFRFHIQKGESALDVYVEPQWGFFLFLIATMSSLVMTHIILAFHRKVSSKSKGDDDNTEPRALCNEIFAHTTRLGPALIVILLLFSITTLAIGITMDSFHFSFQGAAALVLSYLGYPTQTNYSVISVGLAIRDSVMNPDGAGIIFTQVVFFLFALVIPFCHLAVLLLIWLIPLSTKNQRRLFVITEIFNAWSAIDVFIVSVIAALLEIKQFAAFIVGDHCDLINALLQKYFDGPLQGNDVCFSVEATLDQGCWILFASSAVYILGGYMIMRACHKALNKELEKMNEKPTTITTNITQIQ